MQQRIMIAMALMLSPSLIIADEPTTALDVTTQAQIFSLIREMKQNDTSLLLITHDMGVVWEMCDRVVVMYASRIVETGSLDDIFFRPAHPYTKGLLAAIPKLSTSKRCHCMQFQDRSRRRWIIPGGVISRTGVRMFGNVPEVAPGF
jgi:ABC-type dipeptide/oligopeptide/nickel transport system ATPase component